MTLPLKQLKFGIRKNPDVVLGAVREHGKVVDKSMYRKLRLRLRKMGYDV